MTKLVIVDLTVKNKALLAEYSSQAADTIAKYNGQFIAKGQIEILHGDAAHPMKAVIEFPDADSALSWYNSEEYQALVSLRDSGMDSQFHLV